MFIQLIEWLRAYKRSLQRTQLEQKQLDIIEMERATGLHYLVLKKEMPCTLAVVRYSSWADIDDLHCRLYDVTEQAFPNADNQIPKLEHEVVEALHCGVDVVVATAEPIETFPRLKALLTY